MADNADPADACHHDVYQLRAVLGGISPLIWRRLLVTSQTTITGLHAIVQTVFGCDARTRDYLARRITEGKTRREAIRCLKRYLAREIYQIITSPPPAEPSAA